MFGLPFFVTIKTTARFDIDADRHAVGVVVQSDSVISALLNTGCKRVVGFERHNPKPRAKEMNGFG
jgi:hypothetical protein